MTDTKSLTALRYTRYDIILIPRHIVRFKGRVLCLIGDHLVCNNTLVRIVVNLKGED